MHWKILLVPGALLAGLAGADEGMWTFDNPPTRLLEQKYHFTPTQQWLDHIRLSSVRLNDGGSGSFVLSRRRPLTASWSCWTGSPFPSRRGKASW